MKTPLVRGDIAELTGELRDLADPANADDLLVLLRLLYAVGRRDLPLGRLFEGHVDALQIIARYAAPAQAGAAQAAARAGAAFGVWNADLQGEPLCALDGVLNGGKAFASGAGILSHALVNVDAGGGRQLILLDLERQPPAIDTDWWRVTGMQRSQSHVVRWSGQALDDADLIGAPGDYVREPWFSGGALRFAAVQAGGIAAVFDQVRGHLVKQGRAEDPVQSGRLAALYLAAQAAADAVGKAARCWNGEDLPTTLAHVAAARVAVYQAGEQALTLAQAAVGLQAMFVDHPLAATLTDLAVYLRQPGPDAQRARTGQAVASGLLGPVL